MNNDEIWKAILGEIELTISPASFTTWFRNTSISSFDNSQIIISVPNGFAKEWLENKYNHYILQALRKYRPNIKSVRCIVSAGAGIGKRKVDSAVIDAKDNVINLRDQQPPMRSENNLGKLYLNPRYSFENFIVGSNNELAHAACFAVSKNLGCVYNPLFIYGGVGLGKTHLLQSIGNTVISKDPAKKILYSTSERFTDDLVDRIKTKNIRDFKKPYLEADLLIIDDIQFIAGKEKTQEEFFHIFNTLYQLNKQIVLSSDRPPKAIATLEERLRSRFEGGMIADVSRPDLETRIAILEHKAAEKDFDVDGEVLGYIASNIQHNIRELEGALSRVIVTCELKQTEPTLSNVKKILSDLIHSGRKKGVNFKQIIEVVASYYDLATSDLLNRCRRKDIVKPRQIAMYIMREDLKASFPGIGEQLGGRDHSTAMHAYEKISHEIEQDESLEQEINSMRSKLYGQS
jgi:chromosomal replication initiator protein